MSKRRGRPQPREAAFFDYFRAALARLPAGLIRVGPPAAPADLARAQADLGRELPREYLAFLQSFDGADLFHESVVVAGVGDTASLRLDDLAGAAESEPLVFATGAADERYALLDDGRVARQDAGSDERAIAGSTFSRWLDATVAAEQVLYGPDGEYAPDVFDPAGEEITPVIALRQAERALKQDPGSATWAQAQGLALGRLGRPGPAADALDAAAELDPGNPWVWFDLGRCAMDAAQPERAAGAFQRAAALEPGPGGAILLAWAARASSGASARQLAEEALRRDPTLPASLARAIDTAAADDDEAARDEATALLTAVAPQALPPPRVRLPVLQSGAGETARPATEPPPLRSPPPAPRPRPSRGGPPRSGGRRRES